MPDVALTTNGWLLADAVPALRAAGLDRLNISLDSLRPDTSPHERRRTVGRVCARAAGITAAAALVSLSKSTWWSSEA